MNIYFQNEFDFNDPVQVAIFLGDHDFEHHSINRVIAQQLGRAIISMPLWDFGDFTQWLLDHNRVHQAIFTILGGGTAPDISELDINSPQDVKAWQQAHQDLHTQISGILGV